MSTQTTESSGAYLALEGATIYASPTDGPLRDGVVLIHEGKIAAVGARSAVKIPSKTQALDCSGLTIVAGFWNSHVHFFEKKWADAAAIPAPELERQIQDMLTSHGFTSVFDLSSPWENTRRLRERIESGEVPGPRIRSTGQGLLPPGAAPPELVVAMMGIMKTPLPEIADSAQASAAVRKLVGEGVDGVKFFASGQRGGSLPPDVIEAVVSEAHQSRRPVFVHPNTGADVLAAVHGGVDILAHTTPQSGPWDESILSAMRERRVALIPTLQIWKAQKRHERLSDQEKFVAAATSQLRAWAGSGGTVLFGTDAGAVAYDPTEEYVLMAEAGLSFRQILASLSTAPAGRFGESERLGRIAPGLEADLVVLKGDPSMDVRAFATVQYTLRAGKIIYRASE